MWLFVGLWFFVSFLVSLFAGFFLLVLAFIELWRFWFWWLFFSFNRFALLWWWFGFLLFGDGFLIYGLFWFRLNSRLFFGFLLFVRFFLGLLDRIICVLLFFGELFSRFWLGSWLIRNFSSFVTVLILSKCYDNTDERGDEYSDSHIWN